VAPIVPNGNDVAPNPPPAIGPIDPPPLIAMADGRLTVGAGIDDRIPTSKSPAPPLQEKIYSEDEYNFLDAQAAIQLATMQQKNHRMTIITALMLTVFRGPRIIAVAGNRGHLWGEQYRIETRTKRNHGQLFEVPFIVFILSSVLIRRPFVRMNIENGPPIHRA
jgi:hypothetical protein